MAVNESFFSRVVAHSRQPLYRNAYALILNTVGTAGLGLVYWVLAARYYSPEQVGWSAALISAMTFLSSVAQLNLMSVMIRFIPRAGRAAGRLVGRSYLVTLVSSAVISLLVVFSGARTAFLGVEVDPGFAVWFVLATMISCVFLLQDSVLNGLRASIWVPVENISYALIKIVLLLLFAATIPVLGIFASWTIPMVLTLLPVNFLIFSRLIPRHARATAGREEPVIGRQILRYIGANYLGLLLSQAVVRLLPLLIAFRVSSSATAYFYLPWTIVLSLKLISTNMATSLTVEGARDRENFAAQGYRFLVHMARLYIPVVALLVLGAPLVLRLSGPVYASEGTPLLRLLALATLPGIITQFYLGIARVQERTTGIVLVQGLYCLCVLGLSTLWLPRYHLAGAGMAVLVSETLSALVSLPLILQMRNHARKPAPASDEPTIPTRWKTAGRGKLNQE